jgi:dolichol-phosphate mannosyltransferase
MSHVAVLLPTYNEAGNIEAIISRILASVPGARILVIDDSSPDGTGAIVKRLMQAQPRVSLVSRARKEGLGKAYLHGFKEVLADPAIEFLITMDADFSHDPAYLPAMLDAAVDADLVVATRYASGGRTEGWSLWRRMLSSFANRYCALITGMPITDATGGFYVVRADALRGIDRASIASSGYAFQIELKYRLWKREARIAEVPIVFKERREGESKISSHVIAEGVTTPWMLRFKQ